jgi:hypothetical protein
MKFYYEIYKKLKEEKPFKFSRWGDGEWLCMMGEKGENRDGNKYTEGLQKELISILDDYPEYYIGLQYGVLYNEKLRDFVFKNLFSWDCLNLVNGDILHQASEYNTLKIFVAILKRRHTVVIGAEYFKDLPYNHIITPEVNSYQENDRILDEAKQYGKAVFLVANAMNSNVIINRLPNNVTAIDIGSVFDPYLGRPRASYQHKMKAEWLW